MKLKFLGSHLHFLKVILLCLVTTQYDLHQRRVSRNADLPIDQQFVAQHHESSHVATVYQVLQSPNNPTTALAVTFSRGGQMIHPDLPGGYENYFAVDETKAYFKSSKLLAQQARITQQEGGDGTQLSKSAEGTKRLSKRLAMISEVLFLHVKQYVETHVESEMTARAFAMTASL